MRVAIILGLLIAICLPLTAAAQDDEITAHFKNLLLNKSAKLKIDMLFADDMQFGERENLTFFDTEGVFYQSSFYAGSKMETVREMSISAMLSTLRSKNPQFESKRYITLPAGSDVTVSIVFWDQNAGSLTIGLNSDEGLGFIYFEFGDYWSELGKNGIQTYVLQALSI